jgi:hypothetical protein
MEFEPFKRRLPVAAIAAIAIAGCGSSSSETSTQTTPSKPRSPFTRTMHYYPDGTRIVSYENNDPDNQFVPFDVLDSCDGEDLVEETLVAGVSSSSISRSVNHPACADRKLTPSDFK